MHSSMQVFCAIIKQKVLCDEHLINAFFFRLFSADSVMCQMEVLRFVEAFQNLIRYIYIRDVSSGKVNKPLLV